MGHTFQTYSPARGAETVDAIPPENVNLLVPPGEERYGKCAGCGCDGLNCPCDEQVPGSPPATFEGMFMGLHYDCHAVMIERQKKYGPNNIPKFGTFGTLVRMTDKFERLSNMVQNGDSGSVDESIEDTLIDISNYANIMRAQMRGWWTKESCPPLGEDFVVDQSQTA